MRDTISKQNKETNKQKQVDKQTRKRTTEEDTWGQPLATIHYKHPYVPQKIYKGKKWKKSNLESYSKTSFFVCSNSYQDCNVHPSVFVDFKIHLKLHLYAIKTSLDGLESLLKFWFFLVCDSLSKTMK